MLPGPAAPIREVPSPPPAPSNPVPSITRTPRLAVGSPLAQIADELASHRELDDRDFDVFVSHATEHKDAVVRPLAHALRQRGVTAWYDEFEMRIGDSLRQKIDVGVSRSRFGLVVLSPAFFAKNWPQYELDGLVARDMHDGGRRLLPIWHNISKDELIRQSPSLADRVALSTALLTVDEIAAQVAEVINPATDPG